MTAIAFSTDPNGYISNLTQLVAEIRDRLDDSGYSLDKIYRAIGLAEAAFNREIRAPQMEAEVSLSVTGEATDLPLDFLALRSVYVEGSPDNTLRSMSPAGLRNLYQGRAGAPQAYAIENSHLVVGPVGDTSLKLLYFAKLTPLTENNPSNWLLRDYPDLYLHQALYNLFQTTGDRERASDSLGIATVLINQVNGAARKARFGAGPLTPALVAQARGTRI